jgi:pimeloyl-ACP methyl ester carboxylesterase
MQTEIRNSQGEKLDYTFHEGAADNNVVVVIGHGVTGNKDRPLILALSDGLEAAGYSVLRFSFSGNGDSEGDFRDSTISKEVEDLGNVLDALEGKTIYYAGHSMGGAVGVLRASRDPRIKALISLAGMVYTAAFAETEFGGEIPDEGFMWEDEDCPLSSTYVNDMKAIGGVLERASEIVVPWLLVHGTEDDVVPYQESVDIFAKANEPKKLITIEGGGHVFTEAATLPMVTGVVEWVKGLA